MIEETETRILMTQSEMGIAKDKYMKEQYSHLDKRTSHTWAIINANIHHFIHELYRDEHYHAEEDE